MPEVTLHVTWTEEIEHQGEMTFDTSDPEFREWASLKEGEEPDERTIKDWLFDAPFDDSLIEDRIEYLRDHEDGEPRSDVQHRDTKVRVVT